MWAVRATAHYFVTRWLEREVDANDTRGWLVALWTWHALTLGNATYNVVHNHAIGLEPFGSGAEHCR
jgi:hypothetical protein